MNTILIVDTLIIFTAENGYYSKNKFHFEEKIKL